MMNKYLTIIFLLCFYCGKSQFTGGKGDGYASAQQRIIVSGLHDGTLNFSVYPNVLAEGTDLHFSKHISGQCELVSTLGVRYDLGDFIKVKRITLPIELKQGSYILFIRNDDFLYKTPVLIHE